MNNHEIAQQFAEVANLLESQGANRFRVSAYMENCEEGGLFAGGKRNAAKYYQERARITDC